MSPRTPGSVADSVPDSLVSDMYDAGSYHPSEEEADNGDSCDSLAAHCGSTPDDSLCGYSPHCGELCTQADSPTQVLPSDDIAGGDGAFTSSDLDSVAAYKKEKGIKKNP